MSALLLDTHAFAWMQLGDKRPPLNAREAILSAKSVSISAATIYEIGQKTRLGKWPEMESMVHLLSKIAAQSGVAIIAIDDRIALIASQMRWKHRDPFDRIIAATARLHNLALVSADIAFDPLKAPVRRWEFE